MLIDIGGNWEKFTLYEDIPFEVGRYCFVVPIGFVSDGASIPPYVRWLIPKHGRYTNAAILHDWLYTTHQLDRQIADELMIEQMCMDGVWWWRRRLMYPAVRLRGKESWHRFGIQDMLYRVAPQYEGSDA